MMRQFLAVLGAAFVVSTASSSAQADDAFAKVESCEIADSNSLPPQVMCTIRNASPETVIAAFKFRLEIVDPHRTVPWASLEGSGGATLLRGIRGGLEPGETINMLFTVDGWSPQARLADTKIDFHIVASFDPYGHPVAN